MGPLIRASSRKAAVLVALVDHPHLGVCTLLTRRASKLRKHAGEVCFPGGKRDAVDKTDVDTALREAKEEVGLIPERHTNRDRGGITLVCQLERLAQPNFSPPMVVTPVVVTLDYCLIATLKAAPEEVDAIFLAPLSVFLDSGPHHTFEDMELKRFHEKLGNYRAHHFRIDYEGRQFDVWGQTADILMYLATVVFDRLPSFQMKKCENGTGTSPAAKL
eukprot:g244.t1